MQGPTLLESILHGITDVLIHVNRDLICTYINPAAEQILGISGGDALNRPLAEVLSPPAHAALSEPLAKALRTGESAHFLFLEPSIETWYVCNLYPSESGLTLLLRPFKDGDIENAENLDQDLLAGALKASQEQFYALADSAPQIVWTILPSGAVTYINEPGREYFGVGPEDKPFGWSPMLHPEDLSALHRAWKQALETSGMFELEMRLRRHDGVYRWHLARALPVHDIAGNVIHWCGTSTDIHDLKRAHDLLAEREELFRTMADAAPVQIWMADSTSSRIYFNERWLEFRGRAIEEEFHDRWMEGLFADDRERYLETYRRSFDTRAPYSIEFRLRRHDGEYRWILEHGMPLFDSTGSFSGFIGSAVDIHERKQLEEQIRFLAEASAVLTSSIDYESTLRAVADLMVPELADWSAIDMIEKDGSFKLVAVAHVDPEKVKYAYELRERYPIEPTLDTGVVRVVRSGQSELYPDVSEDMLIKAARGEEHLEILKSIGFSSAMIVPLQARGQTLGAMTLVWSESGRHYDESDLRFMEELARRAAMVVDNARLFSEAQDARQDLEKINQSLEARVAERTDELTAANESLRTEVEERKRAQQAVVRANVLLEHRNRELQDFAYVASHDLQEPLRKIMSFSNLLLEEYSSELGEGRPFLERIDNAAGRMMNLIRDLLTFSKVATQGEAFKRVDLNAVVDEVLGDLEVRISETEGHVDVSPLCSSEADELQMRQLFQNLLGNALKFHRENVPPVVTIQSHQDDGFCVVEVQDNGIGFEEKYVDRIFAPFQRLQNRKEYGGTGIGLAICRRIVERHDGMIRAHSAPGEGSTFEIRLPIEHATPRTGVGSEASAA